MQDGVAIEAGIFFIISLAMERAMKGVSTFISQGGAWMTFFVDGFIASLLAR